MSTPVKATGRAMSIPAGIAISGAVSMGATLLMSLLLASMLDSERMTWEQAGYWIMVMLFVSSFAGAKTGMIAIRHQRLAVSLMSGCLYWGLLLCFTALFFGGNYGAVPETAAVITAGSCCAAMLSLPKKRKGRGRRKKRQL